MAENLYSTALVDVMEEKVPELATATDAKAVEVLISQIKKEAAERTPTPMETDPWIYRGTVMVLGLAVLIVAFAQYHLTFVAMTPDGKSVPIPDGLIAIGSAAIGALAGLLAPTPTRS